MTSNWILRCLLPRYLYKCTQFWDLSQKMPRNILAEDAAVFLVERVDFLITKNLSVRNPQDSRVPIVPIELVMFQIRENMFEDVILVKKYKLLIFFINLRPLSKKMLDVENVIKKEVINCNIIYTNKLLSFSRTLYSNYSPISLQ